MDSTSHSISPSSKKRLSASKLLSLFKARRAPASTFQPLSPLGQVQEELCTKSSAQPSHPAAMDLTETTMSVDAVDDDILSNIDVADPDSPVPDPVPITPRRALPARSTRSKANYSDSPRPKTPKTSTPRPKSKRQRSMQNRIVDTDMPLAQGNSNARTPNVRIVKTDTVRNRVREEIATTTKAKRDAYLVHHRHFFLPLLPANNHIIKLCQNDTIQPIVESTPLEKQPENVTATMKPYQLQGLSFLVNMYQNAMPSILGDEMGLGKTLQTLSLIQYLENNHPSPSELPRPYLVVCPLSVLGSWYDEARKWTPKLKALRFHGTVAERNQLKSVALGRTDRYGNELERKKKKNNRASTTAVEDLDTTSKTFDIMITTYEAFLADQNWIKGAFVWRYCILDEGHKIKNDQTNISHALQGLHAEHRLLLTGTPLQNDLREMWALLHWLYPEVFTDKTGDTFKEAFDLGRGQVNVNFMDHARRLLELVMLRRMKSSPGVDLGLPPKHEILLYVPLTPVQRFWYTRLLTKAGDNLLDDLFGNIKQKEHTALVEDLEEESKITENKTPSKHDFAVQSRNIIQQAISNEASGEKDTGAYKKLLNLVMQLRKATIHPYMIKGAAPEPYFLGDHILHASGKFVVLNKLVDELVVQQGKKILIFSTFTKALDYCEDLLMTKGSNTHNAPFRHVRFDGSTQRAVRNLQIKLFNDVTSDYRVMLISTRAGGLGLNLTAASEVIFLDEDWNPQVTLQAESRSHRIGQTKPVTIYKLCTQGTVEEQMMGRIRKKLYLSAKITESMQDIHSNPNQDHSAKRKASQENEQDADDGPDLGVSQLKSLIRRGATTLAHADIDINEMIDWDLKTIIEKCKDRPVDPHVGDRDDKVDEQEWLARMERVECAVFDGVKYQRTLDKKKVPVEDLRREARRAGKNTTVLVDGFAINKESMGCADWEAVPTMAGKDPRLAEPKREKAPSIEHQENCQICFDGGEIYLCSSCPRVYHLDCLPDLYKAKATSKMSFVCSQHNCIDCERSTSNAGGLIYRCRWCHRGYCEDCLDPNAKLVGETLPEYETLGFPSKRNAWYIHCQDCLEREEEEPEIAKMVIKQKALYEKEHENYLEALRESEAIDSEAQTGASMVAPGSEESLTDATTLESSRQLTPEVHDESRRRVVVNLTTEELEEEHPDMQAIEGDMETYDNAPKSKKRRTH